jgi:centromeric protein E
MASTPPNDDDEKEEVMDVGVQVAVRLRPKLPRETKESIVWECKPEEKTLLCKADRLALVNKRKVSGSIHGPYARVFPADTHTEAVHTAVVAPVVESFLSGYNGCVFAYGQTGSGKTHTLMGSHADDEGPRELGVVQHTVLQVLSKMQKDVTRVWFLRVSYLEIYNEKFKDLLRGTQGVEKKGNRKAALSVYDHPDLGPTVRNLTEVPVTGIDQLHELILKGEAKRAVGRTNMNEHSSRSHTMIRLILESKSNLARTNDDNDEKKKKEEDASKNITVSQMYLVDLAGSENVKKSGVEGERFKEATHINQSLHQLTNVILQLADRSYHEYGSFAYNKEKIHYRNSKLTHALSSCLGGNAKTVLLCAASPCEKSLSETHSTLSFARRAAQIVNRVVKVKVTAKNSLMSKHMHDVEQLKNALRGTGGASTKELDDERRALYAETKDAKKAQLVAEQQTIAFASRNSNLRKLYQATHALAGAFPENAELAAVLQERIVGPVHSGMLAPVDGLKELTIVCQEHDETVQMLRDDDHYDDDSAAAAAAPNNNKLLTYTEVLQTSLSSTTAIEGTLGHGLARGMTGILSTNDREDSDYQMVCTVTEALASTFSVWKENEDTDDDGTINMSNPNVDLQFMEKMNEFIVEPLRCGAMNGTEAKALLTTMCAQQADLKGSSLYMDVLQESQKGSGSGGDSGGGGDSGDSGDNGSNSNSKGATKKRTSFDPLPSRGSVNMMGSTRDRRTSTSNEEVLAMFGKIQQRLDRLDEDEGKGLKTIKIKGKKDLDREGNGPCSVGDGCLLM